MRITKMGKHRILKCKGFHNLKELVGKYENDGYEVCGLSERGIEDYTVIFKKVDGTTTVKPNPYYIPVHVPIPTTVPNIPSFPRWEVTCTDNTYITC